MRRKKIGLINVWPGFVDAISTLLLVFVFLLAVLMISENFLTQTLTGKNTALDNLRLRLQSLELNIKDYSKKNKNLSSLIENLNNQLERFKIEKKDLENSISKEKTENKNLNFNIMELESKISALVNELGLEKLKYSQQQELNKELDFTVGDLNKNIISLNNELVKVQNALNQTNAKIERKDIEITDLGNKLNVALKEKVGELEEYRSEFFGRLKKIIGEEKEINIVGDRFVLQSEVFFKSGSAEIGPEGINKVEEITNILLSITKKIPQNINWLIQVEGHTDNIPISTEKFPSNWELSTARAIAVAKIMMDNGISSNKINVAGYGEHKPLTKNNSSENREKNRRIELKLTQP
jgi:chemotaxis protein MotB